MLVECITVYFNARIVDIGPNLFKVCALTVCLIQMQIVSQSWK